MKNLDETALFLSNQDSLLQVLRDASRRSSYDALRSGYGGFDGASSSGAYETNWRPGTDNFDDFFNNWWQRQG